MRSLTNNSGRLDIRHLRMEVRSSNLIITIRCHDDYAAQVEPRGARLMIDIVDKDFIVVCGVRIDRPARISPSQWLRYWERLAPPAMVGRR